MFFQVERSEFMYNLATTQHAQKERAEFSSMGFSSEEITNLKSLVILLYVLSFLNIVSLLRRFQCTKFALMVVTDDDVDIFKKSA